MILRFLMLTILSFIIGQNVVQASPEKWMEYLRTKTALLSEIATHLGQLSQYQYATPLVNNWTQVNLEIMAIAQLPEMQGMLRNATYAMILPPDTFKPGDRVPKPGERFSVNVADVTLTHTPRKNMAVIYPFELVVAWQNLWQNIEISKNLNLSQGRVKDIPPSFVKLRAQLAYLSRELYLFGERGSFSDRQLETTFAEVSKTPENVEAEYRKQFESIKQQFTIGREFSSVYYIVESQYRNYNKPEFQSIPGAITLFIEKPRTTFNLNHPSHAPNMAKDVGAWLKQVEAEIPESDLPNYWFSRAKIDFMVQNGRSIEDVVWSLNPWVTDEA